MVKVLNGVEFDLSKALPLKIRDWRELEKQGINIVKGGMDSIDNMGKVAQHILKKAKPEIADDFVDDLSLDQVADIAKTATDVEEASLNRPT